MLKNFFFITFRNLWWNKGFSIINILGLTIGMASALLIGLWVENEFSYDRFYDKADRIFQLYSREDINGQVGAWSRVSSQMATELKNNYAEVEDAVKYRIVSFLLTDPAGDEKKFNLEGAFADSGFLQVFNLPLLRGDPSTALSRDQGIVLTEQVAKSLFGREDPMGRTVRIDSGDNFKVTGVLKDLPGNTEFTFKYLLPWAYVTRLGWDSIGGSWNYTNGATYALLKPGASQATFDGKIRNIVKRHVTFGQGANRETFTQPLTRAHLYSKVDNGRLSGGEITTVRLFMVIAVFILLIASINFMNLSTARSEKRAREVGIRKVVGAMKGSLVLQFIGESILLSALSFLLALGIVELSLNDFNLLINSHLTLRLDNGYFWLLTIAFILLTGLVAGSYPAFYLSSFRPVNILKGTFKKVPASVTPRKVLVVLQFTFAIMLIVSTIIVERQIRYARDRDAGYTRDRLVYTFVQGGILPHYDLIKHGLLTNGAAVGVSKLFSPMTRAWSYITGFSWPGSTQEDKKKYFVQFEADADFVATTGTKLLEGRDLNLKNYPPDSTGLLLNEAALHAMHLTNPIGAVVWNSQGVKCHVVGVLKDFIIESPYDRVKPMVIQGLKTPYPVVHFLLNPANSIADDLARAEKVFRQYNPQYPFEYNFVNEEYDKKFKAQRQESALGLLFAGLTIFISCLGLFGLASHMAETRKREIGIRKVLGASIFSISTLMAQEFVRLVLIAFLIASPLAWYAMYKWLREFTYRTPIDVWIFLAAGLMAVFIALATISYQAIKAALTNPIISLRTE